MRSPDYVLNHPIPRFIKETAKKHPYLTATVISGLVFGGTLYDEIVNISPIQQQARLEAFSSCNYPSAEEFEFARNLPSNASPIDRQRANQIDARVYGCQQTAIMFENKTLSDSGRNVFGIGYSALELLASSMAGTVLLGTGIVKFLNRRKRMPQPEPSNP